MNIDIVEALRQKAARERAQRISIENGKVVDISISNGKVVVRPWLLNSEVPQELGRDDNGLHLRPQGSASNAG